MPWECEDTLPLSPRDQFLGGSQSLACPEISRRELGKPNYPNDLNGQFPPPQKLSLAGNLSMGSRGDYQADYASLLILCIGGF